MPIPPIGLVDRPYILRITGSKLYVSIHWLGFGGSQLQMKYLSCGNLSIPPCPRNISFRHPPPTPPPLKGEVILYGKNNHNNNNNNNSNNSNNSNQDFHEPQQKSSALASLTSVGLSVADPRLRLESEACQVIAVSLASVEKTWKISEMWGPVLVILLMATRNPAITS